MLRRYFLGSIAYFVFVAILLGSNFGLIYVVINLTKDTKVTNGLMISRDTGLPVQVRANDTCSSTKSPSPSHTIFFAA